MNGYFLGIIIQLFVCVFYYNESETEIGGCPKDEGTPHPGLNKQKKKIYIYV